MNLRHEFELITDKTANFKAFINVLKYRAPHIHFDYEIGIVLYGELIVVIDEVEYTLQKGDIMCLNPCQIHEFKSPNQSTILLIQVNPSYFYNIYPLMHSIEFTKLCSPYQAEDKLYSDIRSNMLLFAELFMKKEEFYELKCAGIMNILFSDLLRFIPHKEVSAQGRLSAQSKADRIRRIADYIENNFEDKIRLSDIAKLEDVTDTYMSHFFADNYHMTFQDYLTKLRCEKARSLLLTTDLSLFDISYSCGFSDPKYLNKGFKKQYGCSPKEYRTQFGHEKLWAQQTSMLTTQQILSDRTSLVLLEKYS